MSKKLVNLSERLERKSFITAKSVEKDSPYYKEFKSRGLLYVLNSAKEDIESLLNGMKGLGFVHKHCENQKELEDRIDSDKESITKYKEAYCVAILTVNKNIAIDENELIKKFHSNNCPKLECKPKLFFFLKLPKSNEVCDGPVSTSPYDYQLAHEADLFIYKHTSKNAVENLDGFIKRLNDANKESYVLDEFTSYMGSIKQESQKKVKDVCDNNSKPTIHDSLTRRLTLGLKDIANGKANLQNIYLNRKISEKIRFINEYIDSNESPFGDDDSVNLKDLELKITRNGNFLIPNGEKILQGLESFIAKNIENNQ